ncbi:cysteine peptidase family C39 domain-containing protein [uncultured Sphingobacterium sp.]|uniref:cysteine peptidase family C39 domain-containing protein n=1 Tax=uncultured Sphingobacterium sp. TaxID=182688 RepID=UPI0025D95A04|nr:cysteine peptidase family C39 domain-containing protein [uncultured Sphingobacterium sp.]
MGRNLWGLRTLAAHCSYEQLVEKVPLPAIIHWDDSHFIVLYKKKSSNRQAKLFVADPGKGYINYDKDEFIGKWYKKVIDSNSRVILLLQPQADFKQRQPGEKAERNKQLENLLGYFTPYKKAFYIWRL